MNASYPMQSLMLRDLTRLEKVLEVKTADRLRYEEEKVKNEALESNVMFLESKVDHLFHKIRLLNEQK